MLRPALGEVVALHHPRQRVLARQPDDVVELHLPEPLGVVDHLGLLRVQHLEGLLGVGLGALEDLLTSGHRAGGAPAGGVADHRGEVADEEDHLVPQLLELAHLVHQHRVAEVQIRARRVEAGLDLEGAPLLQPLQQLLLDVEVDDAALQLFELLFGTQVRHGGGSMERRSRRATAPSLRRWSPARRCPKGRRASSRPLPWPSAWRRAVR